MKIEPEMKTEKKKNMKIGKQVQMQIEKKMKTK
jgi:hypothetical protein